MAAASRKPPRGRLGDPEHAKARLRRTMLLTLALVALPMGVIVARTYSQLRGERGYRDRRAAEEVTAQFDRRLLDTLKPEEDRPVEDYQFFKSAGNALQLSPLAGSENASRVPGIVGYFQIDSSGRLSSPLLPEDEVPPSSLSAYGLSADELTRRRGVVRELHGLVSSVSLSRLRQPERAAVSAPVVAEADKKESLLPSQAKKASRSLEERSPRKSLVNMVENQISGLKQAANEMLSDEASSDQAFSERAEADAAAPAAEGASSVGAKIAREDGFGAAAGAAAPVAAAKGSSFSAAYPRGGRSRGAESETAAKDKKAEVAQGGAGGLQAPNAAPLANLAVTSFMAEIDPFQALVLDSGHVLFYRRVWREQKQIVQGFVAKSEPLVRSLAEGSFLTSALAARSGLAILAGARSLGSFAPSGWEESLYSSSRQAATGAEYARFPVAPPLAQVSLVFTGGGGSGETGELLLHFLTLAVALVLLAGFHVVYKASARQIDLAAERSDFVSAVSHELKTPLTSIRMYAEMLKGGMAQDPAKQASYFDFILSESERLSRLIGNVLQLAKLSKGVPVASPKPVPAGRLLEQVRAKAAPVAQAAGFTLTVRAEDPAAAQVIEADEDCFTQMLLNLVDNALKFSAQAAEKTVELGLRREPGGGVAFTVRDFGPGVPKEERRKIFQLFYRAENELTRRTPGTGIGLALVTELAAQMRATVDMQNKEPRGAEFRVIFPAR